MASATNTVSMKRQEAVVTGAVALELIKAHRQGGELTIPQYKKVAEKAAFLAFTIIECYESGETGLPLAKSLMENPTRFLASVDLVVEVDQQLKKLPKNLRTLPSNLHNADPIISIAQHIMPKVVPKITIPENCRCPIKNCRQIFPADGSSVCTACNKIIRCGKSKLGDHDPEIAAQKHFLVCPGFTPQTDDLSHLMARVALLHPVTPPPSEAASAADKEPKPLVRTCGHCGKTPSELEKKLLKCGQCWEMFYCNQSCQSKDWPKHKLACQIREHKR